MNVNFRDVLDPLGRKPVRNIDEDLPLRHRAYIPFLLAALALTVLYILKSLNGRWFTGVAVIFILIGTFLLFYYNDVFKAGWGINSGDREAAVIRGRRLARDANKRNRYAFSYFILGSVLELISLYFYP